jgi:methionyl-tRNA formyltransferase
VPIGPRATAAELRDVLVAAGTDLLVDTLARPLQEPAPQHGEVTYAAKIEPFELEIDWTTPATSIDRWIRVGPAWTTFRGRRLKVLAGLPVDGGAAPGAIGADGCVGTGDGLLRLDTVQPEGRGPMAWAAFANGAHLRPDDRLGDATS